jgi:hypothetical protein
MYLHASSKVEQLNSCMQLLRFQTKLTSEGSDLSDFANFHSGRGVIPMGINFLKCKLSKMETQPEKLQASWKR